VNTLDRIEIAGLWGSRDVDLRLRGNVNFLIGPNGSGKTTVINAVVAALAADVRALAHLRFETIRITLKAVQGRKKPIVEVRKTTDSADAPESITYFIRSSTSAKPDSYALDEMDDFFRYSVARRRRVAFRRRFPSEANTIRERLDELFRLSWLSIHRSKSFRHLEDEDSYDSTVDNKLSDLSNEFVRYFSSLSQQSSQELLRFQESVFLSLLMEQRQQALLSSLRKMDLKQEEDALTEIYMELKVSPERFRKRVSDHFTQLRRLVQKFDSKEGPTEITSEEFSTLMTNIRVHHVVREWNELREKQDAIFEPRETFLGVLNGLVRGKEFLINAKNELTATLSNGKNLPLHRLSSGEKQMVIILGEALLQSRTPAIYVADEPELSLHVEWQQALVSNVLSVNPHAQILFATHSPDIVGKYSDGLIDVEEILR